MALEVEVPTLRLSTVLEPQEDRACVYAVSFWVPSPCMAHSLCSEGVVECMYLKCMPQMKT